MSECQTTLAAAVSLDGCGIHSGRECRVTLLPAAADHGVRFVRTDLPGAPEIPAEIASLSEEPMMRRTILCNGDVSVETVEHILAVLHGFGIDNARVEMTAAEPPIWDGSAKELARLVGLCGVKKLEDTERKVLRVTRPVSFVPEDSPGVEFTAWPSDTLTLTYFLNYDHPIIGTQTVSFTIDPETTEKEIAPARTFCTEEEVAFLRSKGLIRGGNIDNAIVVGRSGILNTELLWPDELARHKLLDFLGDLLLLGLPARGHFTASRGGHHANAQFVRYLRKEFSEA
jgi:UDP-3-O-[3-hydroxymyristoyl] N-acetylglucosamine deacetylase